MEVLRDTDGSYLFTFSESEHPGDVEHFTWDSIKSYFLTLVAGFERDFTGSSNSRLLTPESIEKTYHFEENIDWQCGWIGYCAIRADGLACPEVAFQWDIMPPEITIELAPADNPKLIVWPFGDRYDAPADLPRSPAA